MHLVQPSNNENRMSHAQAVRQAQYVMGHDDRERQRLALQGSILKYPMDGGPDRPFYEWMVESVRSIAPRAAAAGIIKESALDIDALEQQLREEAASRNASVPGPTMVGCFARKP